jgi:hypothetical protein
MTSEDKSGSTQPLKTHEIVSLIENAVQLWHSPDKRPFVTAKFPDGTVRHLDVFGKEFHYIVLKTLSGGKKPAPSNRLIREAIERLAGMAIIDGEEHEVFRRVSKVDGVVYVDLCNDDWQFVRVDKSGWSVVKNPPVKLVRTSGMRPLPNPVRGGKLQEFRRLLPGVSFDDWIKIQGFLVGVFNPDGTQPVLVISGRQGSGKSKTAEMVRNLVDANQVPIRTMPRKIDELFVAAENSHLLAFDNLSHLTAEQSDAIAQISSGGGMTKRKLYSDTDEVAITTRQPMMLNGITDVVDRADLDERSLHVELDVMDPKERRLDSEIKETYEEMRPRLLGSILSAVSVALNRWDIIELDEMPRLAELTKFVTAAEPELQMEPGDFARVLKEQNSDRATRRAELEPVVAAIRDGAFTVSAPVFEGTYQDLLGYIEDRLPGPPGSWGAKRLSNAIKRVEADLNAIGIYLERMSKSNRGYPIRLIHR